MTEDGIQLTDTLGSLQEQVWAAEQCRASVEAEAAALSRELSRKQAALSKYLTAQESKETIQAVIEETMLTNMRLRDQKQKLTADMARFEQTES